MATLTDTPVRARRPRLVTPAFVLVAVATLAYFVADAVVLPVVPLYVTRPLGGGAVAVGISVGAFSVAALLLRPWAGRLADRRGRRLLMVLGPAIFGASVAAYGLATTVPALVGLRLLTGTGEAFFFVGAASAINDMAPDERRGEAVSFFSLSLYLGIGIGPAIGEAVHHAAGFTPVWIVSAGIAGTAVLLGLLVRETKPESAEGPVALVHPAALMPGTILLAGLLGMSAFFAFVPLYARALDLGGSRLVFVVFSAIVITIRLFGATIPDRLGSVRASRIALALSAVGLAIMGLFRSGPGLYAGTAVFALGVALTFPALMVLALSRAPASERGAVVGTFTAFVDVSFGLGPAALGFVAAAVGFAGTFLVTAGLAAAGLAFLLVVRPGRSRPPAVGTGELAR